LLKQGDRVWVENPGFPLTRKVLDHLHITAVPVRVDEEGMVVSDGIESAPAARAAVVTPAHQSPLCVLTTPLICQIGPKTSVNSGWSCSIWEKRCISGWSLVSGIAGIRS
jgi:GntR family transcriptional regulator/MocR family aminotransferase